MTPRSLRWDPAAGPPDASALISLPPQRRARRRRIRIGLVALLSLSALVGAVLHNAPAAVDVLSAVGVELTAAESACVEGEIPPLGARATWEGMGTTQRAAMWRALSTCTGRLSEVATPLVADVLGLDPASTQARCATDSAISVLGPSALARPADVSSAASHCLVE